MADRTAKAAAKEALNKILVKQCLTRKPKLHIHMSINNQWQESWNRASVHVGHHYISTDKSVVDTTTHSTSNPSKVNSTRLKFFYFWE